MIANVTYVGSPARGERDVLGMFLDLFQPVQPAIMVREQLCDVGMPS